MRVASMVMVLIAAILLSLPTYRHYIAGLNVSDNDLRLFAGAAVVVAVGLFLLGRQSTN
jgi:hypothetical protein